MYDENLIKYLGYDKNDYNDARMQFEFSNVLCGMKIPGISKIIIDEPVSKSDIKPTFAQICNLTDTFSMGTSLFNRKSYVVINNGKIITKKYYYDGDSWLNIENGEKVDMDSLTEEQRNLLNSYVEESIHELDISNSVVINNLLQNELE